MKTLMTLRPNPQQGFSLIEMMIAVTIGLLLLAGLGTVYLESRRTFRQQEALARMQEGARYAFEVMTLDIRQAGYTGCAPKNKTYSTLAVSTPPDWFNDLATRPLFGYESGAGLPTVVTGALANTDAVSVLRADDSGNFRVQNHNGTSATIQLLVPHNLQQGEILTAVPPDCSMAATFQMVNVNNNSTTSQVVHNTGNAVTPGNSTECLGDPGPPTTAPCASPNPATNPPLPADSKIMRLSGRIYYLRNNSTSSEPSLFRENLSTNGGNAASVAEELAEGVENMQIRYGEDTTADGNIDQYRAANAVTNWDKVFAVQVSLLMRSVENNVVSQPQAVTFNGATVNTGAGADRRLRKVFTATIAVRNRL